MKKSQFIASIFCAVSLMGASMSAAQADVLDNIMKS
jgi:hypothetical protein